MNLFSPRNLCIAVLAASLSACGTETLNIDEANEPLSNTPDDTTTPPHTTQANVPPQISGVPPAGIEAGQLYEFIPVATDADNDPLSFSVSNPPTWASFEPTTGTLSGTPGAADAGNHGNIIIGVDDGEAVTYLPAFSIEVTQEPQPSVNTAPEISGTPTTTLMAGSEYLFRPNASDAEGDPLTFSISNLPAWASFDSRTGQLDGTPTNSDAGTTPDISISVSDGRLSTSLTPFSLTVVDTTTTTDPSRAIYVDTRIGAGSCADYSPALRRCGEGGEQAYNSLSGAASNASAGDTVYLREGTYSEGLYPRNSGTATLPITYTRYNGETATISNPSLSPAIDISNRQYLVIDGLVITDVRRWLHARQAHYNIIQNNTFSRALDAGGSAKTGIFFEEATFNKLLNNTIADSTQDNIYIVNAHNNLIKGNTVRKAAHALWAIKCGDFNVLRDNYFHNEDQKIGEIYDCDSVGFDHQFNITNSTQHNMVEGNEFAYAPSSGNSSPYSGIQYSAQRGIIRKNIFHDITGPALQMALYGGEARYNTDNRIYHNVFFRTDYAGVEISGNTSAAFSGNLFKNNIFTKSVFVPNDTRWDWYTGELNGQGVQIKTGRLNGFEFDSNGIFNTSADERYLIAHGNRSRASAPQTLSWWQDNYPELFKNSVEKDPLFRDEEGLDFTLTAASPMIDAGAFLTTTIGSGTSNVLPVQDASYFYDGYGISGEVGDEIQLENSQQRAIITRINYNDNRLTLDREISWADGQGVSLTYHGAAPDIGAYEYP